MEHLHVSWDQYHDLIERLALMIDDSGWAFDQVLCLARGGTRVGDILSRIYDKPLAVLSTSSYRASAGTQQGELIVARHFTAPFVTFSGNVLVVDDMVDSGVTMRAIMSDLPKAHPHVESWKTAVLWMKGSSVFKPDYIVEYLPTNPWIHQPFEIYDSLGAEALRKRRGKR